MTDSTDAGGVTEDREQWLLQQSQFTNAEVNRMLDRAEKAESALATLTRERDSLKSRLEQADVTVSEVFGALHNPFIGDDARMEKLAELLPITLSQYDRKAPGKPATSPAPLPDAQACCVAGCNATVPAWRVYRYCDKHSPTHNPLHGKEKAPLPGGQRQVEAGHLVYADAALKNSSRATRNGLPDGAFLELRIAVRHIIDHLKEQGGEGREG